MGWAPGRITAGDWAPDGRSLMLRTQTRAYLYGSLGQRNAAEILLPATQQVSPLGKGTSNALIANTTCTTRAAAASTSWYARAAQRA